MFVIVLYICSMTEKELLIKQLLKEIRFNQDMVPQYNAGNVQDIDNLYAKGKGICEKIDCIEALKKN